MQHKLKGGLLILFVLFFVSSCITNPATHRKELNLLPPSAEVSLGSSENKKIIKEIGVYRYDGLNDYIRSVGKRLLKYVQEKRFSYSFNILDSYDVNAFSIPGGYVYLTRGILAYIDNEAQLACVLGHELGHINAHHGAVMMTRQMLFNLGLGVAASSSKKLRKIVPFVAIGGNLLFLSFSRDQEYQADYLGVEYATLAGYDAMEMARLFEKLKRIEHRGGVLGEFLSTHPSFPHREEKIAEFAKHWRAIAKRPYYIVGDNRYLRHIDGILFGKDKRYGYVDGGWYFHPLMRFRFRIPHGFKLIDRRNFIVIFPPNSGGVYIRVSLSGMGITALVDRFLRNGKVIKSRWLTIGGFRAYEAYKLTNSGSLVVEGLYAIDFRGRRVVFLTRCPYNKFAAFRGALRVPALSFGYLSDPRRIHIKNSYIKIVRVRRDSTFSGFLDRFGVEKDLRKTIYLINGSSPQTRLKRGQLVKIIVKHFAN
ncbi:M48 family metalloprotease [Hippea sp. KM1]|uniref:M48 family metalloprotease n=1 Tax=Hippea sp. KM1 TaxID=944481 RepID=UPI00046CD1A4|nr:M48 family metalloprotease [Hippea sp. KM1]